MQIQGKVEKYTSSMNNGNHPVSGTVAVQNNGVSLRQTMLNQLTAGHVFEGSILERKGDQVLLGLSNGQTIEAKLQAALDLIEGQSVFFQVKSNDGTQIQITPYLNGGNMGNPTLLKALEAASLPVTPENIQMVDTMMQEQMGIDKQSLGTMARLVIQNPDIDLKTLVQLVKLNLPLTPETAQQFENYKQDQGALMRELDPLMEELPQLIEGKGLTDQEAIELNRQVMDLLLESVEEGAQTKNQGLPDQNAELQQAESSQQRTETSQQADPLLQRAEASQQKGVAGSEIASGTDSGKENMTLNAMAEEESVVPGEESAVPGKESALPEGRAPMWNTVSQEQRTAFLELFQAMGDSQTIQKELQDPALTTEKLLEIVRHTLDSTELPAKSIRMLLSSDPYKDLIQNTLKQQWLLTPQQVSQKGQIEKLYQRLMNQMEQVEQLMQTLGKDAAPVRSTAASVQSNLEFMNQVNQFYNYVQLPLKMTRGQANGELYVYTRKKSQKDPDEELSAYLHLDLDHLGSTDISVKLKGKDVDTSFSMSDENSYQLILAHTDQLEEMLNKKGYRCKITAEHRVAHKNLVQDVMQTDAVPKAGIVHRYSFDVKA